MERVEEIKNQLQNKSAEDILQYLSDLPYDKVVFSSSFGYEDQIISHLIFSKNLKIELFTLDTGRLFQETYLVFNSTLEKYKQTIKVYYPKTEAVEKLVGEKGPSSFYESLENRKECCFIRKVEPLKRALNGKTIWVTGIRAEQSADRNELEIAEWDEENQLIKIHPLLKWTLEEVKSFITKNNIPYNPLHDKGFESIGCAPCTRAIKNGENSRAGRWWWEQNDKKECGLHYTND